MYTLYCGWPNALFAREKRVEGVVLGRKGEDLSHCVTASPPLSPHNIQVRKQPGAKRKKRRGWRDVVD